MTNNSNLEKFLFDPNNSHVKESLINNKLIFDLKLAAANRGYFLNVFTPEVDKVGFDMIFDDQDLLTKVQLKTVMKKAKTNSWEIHKVLLRPDCNLCEDLGFESSPTGTGYQGGIILIELEDCKNGFKVEYYYTDIIYLCALVDNIINVKDKPSKRALKTFIKSVTTGTSHETVTIYKNMFLKAKNPDSLLALMGLHSNLGSPIHKFHIQKIVSPRQEDKLASSFENLKISINNDLSKISESIVP